MATLENGEQDKLKNEQEAITEFINGIKLPVLDTEGFTLENADLVEAIRHKFNLTVSWAAKQNKLPF